jgi:AcrR family transcriptional regulator
MPGSPPIPPARTERSARAHQVVAAARKVIEADGRDALTMRRLGDELGIRAPSLYKHFADKAAVEVAVIEEVLAEVGEALHAAVAQPRPAARTPVESLLRTYRRYGLAHPHLYRLATSGPLDRKHLPPGLDEWAGQPFFLATGDPHRAQALWSLAHGMVILEIDGRYADPDPRELDKTWKAAAQAFT